MSCGLLDYFDSMTSDDPQLTSELESHVCPYPSFCLGSMKIHQSLWIQWPIRHILTIGISGLKWPLNDLWPIFCWGHKWQCAPIPISFCPSAIIVNASKYVGTVIDFAKVNIFYHIDDVQIFHHPFFLTVRQQILSYHRILQTQCLWAY